MITNKHLKELGFSKIKRKSYIHNHKGIIHNKDNKYGYWYLRNVVCSSTQLKLNFYFEVKNQKSIVYETLSGVTKCKIDIYTENFIPFIHNSTMYNFSFYREHNDKQLRLFII